jgi:excisionase family DNA binding protein
MEAMERATPLPISDGDQKEVLELYRKMQRGNPKLVGSDGEARNLPGKLYDFLVQLISDLSAGRSVAIIQKDATLTTVEAARMLGVSRAFLIQLLDRGSMPFHKVGTHRRIYARDVLKYKVHRDKNRRKGLDQLVQAEIDERLYDRIPMTADDNAGQ